MNIEFEPQGTTGSGALVARDGDEIIGRVGWYIAADGTWVFNSLHVAEGHRGQGVATALMDAARERRVDAGDPRWRHTPPTVDGAAAVDKYVAKTYDTDPREATP